jgi:hypothetical protein
VTWAEIRSCDTDGVRRRSDDTKSNIGSDTGGDEGGASESPVTQTATEGL